MWWDMGERQNGSRAVKRGRSGKVKVVRGGLRKSGLLATRCPGDVPDCDDAKAHIWVHGPATQSVLMCLDLDSSKGQEDRAAQSCPAPHWILGKMVLPLTSCSAQEHGSYAPLGQYNKADPAGRNKSKLALQVGAWVG